MVSVHGSVLEIAADLAENTGNPTHRKKKEMEQFVVVRPEDVEKPKAEKDQAALNDYLKYLAPGFELEDADTKTKARPQPGPRLKVQRRNGHWEMVLRAHKHNDSKKAYVGSLELSGVLRPLVASLPFDDILLVSGNGTIVYQRDKVGPQFTTLTRLLQAQAGRERARVLDVSRRHRLGHRVCDRRRCLGQCPRRGQHLLHGLSGGQRRPDGHGGPGRRT